MLIQLASPNGRYRIGAESDKGAMIVSDELRLKDGRIAHMLEQSRGLFIMGPIIGRLLNNEIRTGSKPEKIRHPDDYALHGFFRKRPTDVVSRTESAATFEGIFEGESENFSWPTAIRYCISYEVTDRGLRIKAGVDNFGKRKVATGLGIHPFFNYCPVDGCERPYVTINAKRYFPFVPPLVPRGGIEEIPVFYQYRDRQILPHTRIDHTYYDLVDAQGTAEWKDLGLTTVVRDETGKLKHLHFWTGNDSNPDVFALELQTGVANAGSPSMTRVRSSGVVMLPPKKSLSIDCSIEFVEA